MKGFGKVAIVGTGLIGGSLGLAIKRGRLASRVIGVSRTREGVETALKVGAVDEGSRDIHAVRGADLIVLCLPVGEIVRQAPAIVALAGPETVICDAGSTKEEICRAYGRLTRRFVGCHPMAGMEKRGAANATAALFDGALCIITPCVKTDRDAVNTARRFWGSFCARIATLTPAEHDRTVAAISHLPHAAASTLVNAVPRAALPYSASGFRDTTRLAASDETVWKDIFLSNRRQVGLALARYEKRLRALRNAIVRGDEAALKKTLAAAKNTRLRLTK